MKNILITACYEVDHMYGLGEVKYEDYQNINKKCVESFENNLKDLDQSIVLDGHVDTYHKLFQEIYWRIKDIYRNNQPCNLLWSDSDNICLRPVEIFNKFDKFAMFYWSEQYRTSFVLENCIKLTTKLIPWMMANLRYYPSGMSDFLWSVGDDLAYSWIEDWAYECIIYNKMFHSQDITDFDKYFVPEWNVQSPGGLDEITSHLVRNAVILHCHSTRGSSWVIPKMDRALNWIKEEK
jgi:hypothetical protein